MLKYNFKEYPFMYEILTIHCLLCNKKEMTKKSCLPIAINQKPKQIRSFLGGLYVVSVAFNATSLQSLSANFLCRPFLYQIPQESSAKH